MRQALTPKKRWRGRKIRPPEYETVYHVNPKPIAIAIGNTGYEVCKNGVGLQLRTKGVSVETYRVQFMWRMLIQTDLSNALPPIQEFFYGVNVFNW